MTTLVSEWPSAGRIKDSGSLTGTVSAFGAVAPTIIPSSRPAPDRLRATMGSDSGLQASLRITRLMTHSTVPACPWGPVGWVDTRVTWSYLRWRTCAATAGANAAPPYRRLSDALVVALQTRTHVLAQRRGPAEDTRQIRLNNAAGRRCVACHIAGGNTRDQPGCLKGCDRL